MNRHSQSMSIIVFVLSGLILPAYTDTVSLNNGDRITGTVTSVADGKLSIETAYAGTLSISLEAITGLKTEKSLAVKLSDNRVLEGVLCTRDETQGIAKEDAWQAMPVEEIVVLAPDMEALDAAVLAMRPKLWSGAVEAGASLRSGNTDTTDMKLSLSLKRATEKDTLDLKFSAAYGEAEDVLNTRRYTGDFRWQHKIHDRFYFYTMGLAERDDGRKLDLRLQGGAGFGYEILKQEKTQLSADLGLTYTYERWAPFTPWERDQVKADTRNGAFSELSGLLSDILDDGLLFSGHVNTLQDILARIRNPLGDYARQTEQYPNLQIGVRFSRNLFKESVLSEELTLLPNLEDMGEFRALSLLALTTPLSESISVRTSLKSEYDSLADQKAVEEWDHLFMTEIRYSF